MSMIDIEKAHGLGLDEARERISKIAPDLKSKYRVDLIWSGDRAKVKGPGFSGSAWVDADRLGMNIKLGLLLKPIAGKIKRAIESAIDDALRQ